MEPRGSTQATLGNDTGHLPKRPARRITRVIRNEKGLKTCLTDRWDEVCPLGQGLSQAFSVHDVATEFLALGHLCSSGKELGRQIHRQVPNTEPADSAWVVVWRGGRQIAAFRL